MNLLRLCSVFVLLCLTGASLVRAKDTPDDLIYDQVRMKLASDREVGAAGINVKVTNGVVELSGNVKRDPVRSKAEKIAKRVKGVKSVVNDLKVSPDGGPPANTH